MSLKRPQSGLTLLEMLVVFVIVAMVTAVLVPGLSFGLSLYERVEQRSRVVEREVLASNWFRQVNRSLVASTDPGNSLVGDSSSFTAVTTSPLLSLSGMPTTVIWKIEDGTLMYGEGEQEFVMISLPEDAEWRYGNAGGQQHADWPLSADDYLLPVEVVLVSDGRGIFRASIQTRRKANLLLEESRRER